MLSSMVHYRLHLVQQSCIFFRMIGSAARHIYRLRGASNFPVRGGAIRQLSIIGDAFTKIATNKMESDKDKTFATMMEAMLSGEKWTLRPWKKTLDDQMSSWIMYIPGMKDSAESKQLAGFKAILGAMSPAELDNPLSIDLTARERIARAADKTPDDVALLLHFYKQSYIVQQWLTLKKSNGEKLPTTEPELRVMQDNDIRVRSIGSKLFGGAGNRRKGRGRGSPF